MNKFYIILISWAYCLVGTRVRVKDIYDDIETKTEALCDYYAAVNAYRITKCENKFVRRVTKNRLKACCYRVFEFLVGRKFGWDLSDDGNTEDQVLEEIKEYFKDEISIYENTMTTNTDVIFSDLRCQDSELDVLFLLGQYLTNRLLQLEAR